MQNAQTPRRRRWLVWLRLGGAALALLLGYARLSRPGEVPAEAPQSMHLHPFGSGRSGSSSGTAQAERKPQAQPAPSNTVADHPTSPPRRVATSLSVQPVAFRQEPVRRVRPVRREMPSLKKPVSAKTRLAAARVPTPVASPTPQIQPATLARAAAPSPALGAERLGLTETGSISGNTTLEATPYHTQAKTDSASPKPAAQAPKRLDPAAARKARTQALAKAKKEREKLRKQKARDRKKAVKKRKAERRRKQKERRKKSDDKAKKGLFGTGFGGSCGPTVSLGRFSPDAVMQYREPVSWRSSRIMAGPALRVSLQIKAPLAGNLSLDGLATLPLASSFWRTVSDVPDGTIHYRETPDGILAEAGMRTETRQRTLLYLLPSLQLGLSYDFAPWLGVFARAGLQGNVLLAKGASGAFRPAPYSAVYSTGVYGVVADRFNLGLSADLSRWRLPDARLESGQSRNVVLWLTVSRRL